MSPEAQVAKNAPAGQMRRSQRGTLVVKTDDVMSADTWTVVMSCWNTSKRVYSDREVAAWDVLGDALSQFREPVLA